MKCPRCPVNPDLPCVGERHAPVCLDVASGKPGRAAQLVAISEGLPSPPPPDPDPDFRPRFDPTDGRVRVGLWMPCMNLGGAETWQLSLIRSIDADRIAWTGAVVTDGRAGTDPGMAAEHARSMPVGYGMHAARRLAEASDVILSWSTLDLAAELAGIATRPAIVHCSHFDSSHHFPEEIADWLTPTDRWAAVSDVAREWVHPRFRDRTSIIWNAVDPDRLAVRRSRAEMRRAWGVPDGLKVAGYLGRFSPEKDPRAMLRLAQVMPAGWIAVAVGGGAELAPIREAAHPRLILPGPDLAAGDVLGAFDALVVPSLQESFGLTIAEGLWVGVPVISTPVGLAAMVPGLTREVPIGATGPELAAAVAEGPEAARIARGMAFARERLTLERFGREWSDLLCSAAEGRRPAPGIDPAVRDAVLTCPDRGPEGGLALLDEERTCCGGGPELTACKAGKGDRPGRVKLPECLACKSA